MKVFENRNINPVLSFRRKILNQASSITHRKAGSVISIFAITSLLLFINCDHMRDMSVYAFNQTISNQLTDMNAQSIYEEKSAVVKSGVNNFVILIPDEAHESTNQPKNQYPLANQPYIPQNVTINNGTSITWFSGDVDHDHVIKFKSPSPQNLQTTDTFPFLGLVTVMFDQAGKYSYYEDNVNSDDKSFVMEGTINVINSTDETNMNTNSSQGIITAGVLMIPSKDFDSISSTLKNNGISVLSNYTFTDLRGGQKGTGPTQTIIVWGSENNNVDQALAPIISITKDLPYS